MSNTSNEIRAITSRWVDSPMKVGVSRVANGFEMFENEMDGLEHRLEGIKDDVVSFDKRAREDALKRQFAIKERFCAIEKAHDELSKDLARKCKEDDEYQRVAYVPPLGLMSEYRETDKYEDIRDAPTLEKLRSIKEEQK